jgi:hypothetical protein
VILVISDIHNRIDAADKIIASAGVDADRIVLLGDYFDSLGDGPGDMARTGSWLRSITKDPRVVALIGNHDMSYIHPDARCSGWSRSKQVLFDVSVRPWISSALKPCWKEGGVLFTHAGLSAGVNLEEQAEAVELVMDGGPLGPCLDAHVRDGGSCNPAGILWNRPQYNKLNTGDYRQVFGHTRLAEPAEIRGSVALDTDNRHFAVVTEVGGSPVIDVRPVSGCL